MANFKPTKRIVLIAALVATIVALISVIVFVVTRPTEADYKTASDSLLPKAMDAQAKLPAAANAYFKAFGDAQNSTGSAKKASQATTDELKTYEKAKSAARSTAEDLTESHITNDSETGMATRQFADASNDYIDYFSTLVGSYGLYKDLFDDQSKICSDIFVGDTASFAERSKRLSEAAKDCHTALTKLEKSGNASYVDYAIKMDRQLTQLEGYSVGAAKGEKEYQQFTVEFETAQKKLAALDAKGASDKEYNALKADIEDTNDRIKQSKSSFESAASRYVSTVKGLPKLYAAVFDESVPARLKSLKSLTDNRSQVLEITLDDKLIK